MKLSRIATVAALTLVTLLSVAQKPTHTTASQPWYCWIIDCNPCTERTDPDCIFRAHADISRPLNLTGR